MYTSNRTIKWIENLAEQELLIRSGERVAIDITVTKDEVLLGETAAFLKELFFHFEYLVGLFNGRVNQPGLEIKLRRLGEKLEGFTLERNRMRLVVAQARPGMIQIHAEKLLVSDGLAPYKASVMFSSTIEAGFGSFHDVTWECLGNAVSAEPLARHYLTEFIQTSR